MGCEPRRRSTATARETPAAHPPALVESARIAYEEESEA